MNRLIAGFFCVAIAFAPSTARAQGTVADYKRAMGLRDLYQNTVLNLVDQARWLETSNRLVYRKTVSNPVAGEAGHEFVVVDAGTGTKRTPFDHEKLAAALSAAASEADNSAASAGQTAASRLCWLASTRVTAWASSATKPVVFQTASCS